MQSQSANQKRIHMIKWSLLQRGITFARLIKASKYLMNITKKYNTKKNLERDVSYFAVDYKHSQYLRLIKQ
jgi:hypothetical protein